MNFPCSPHMLNTCEACFPCAKFISHVFLNSCGFKPSPVLFNKWLKLFSDEGHDEAIINQNNTKTRNMTRMCDYQMANVLIK